VLRMKNHSEALFAREKLREAIKRRTVVLRQIEGIRTSEQLALESVGAKRRALGDAIGGVAKATSDLSRKAARVALEKAQQELNDAIKEHHRIQNQHIAAEKELQAVMSEVADRVKDVVRSDPATQRLALEFVELQRQIAELRPVMELLSGSMLPNEFRFWRAEPGPPPQSAMREAWQRAIAALHTDSMTELPQESREDRIGVDDSGW
jgi:chromosome segregation ATPase